MGNDFKWLGHACFKVTGSKTVYIDPFELKEGDGADVVLVTHDHYDHLSVDDIKKVVTPETEIFAPMNCTEKLAPLGAKFTGVQAGETYEAAGVAVQPVAAYNVGKEFHPRTLGVGYLVTMDGESFYHAGDTDHIPEMEGLRPDVALLPVGGTYTMTAEEAAEAFRKLGAKRAIPMHYGSIVGTDADAERFKKLIGG